MGTRSRADELLLKYGMTNDQDAFTELANLIRPRLMWFLFRRFRHWQQVEDMAQDTLLRLHQKAHQYRGEATAITWILRIALRIGLCSKRKRWPQDMPRYDDGRPRDVTDPSGDAPEILERREFLEMVDASPIGVVKLTDIQELRYQDAARILGIPEGTVRSRRHREIAWIREQLASEPRQAATDLP